MILPLLVACSTVPTTVGSFVVTAGDDGGLTIDTTTGKRLVDDLRFAVGAGGEDIAFSAGSYRVEDTTVQWTGTTPDRPGGDDAILVIGLASAAGGGDIATLSISEVADRVLRIDTASAADWLRWDAACTGDDHFAGLGSQVDTDHVGEAFPLWVSEPGIGKVEDDDPPDDWFLVGTKHATSYPDPFLLRPEPMGLAVATTSRVEVDLCTGDRWRVDTWDDAPSFLVFDGDTPLDVVKSHALAAGEPALPPDWAFAPWNDAVQGADRVRTVASELRDAGAPSSVIWTEDWKGGEDTSVGYRLLAEWDLDTTLYPDATTLDAELEAQGFKWLAYFAPFVGQETAAWDEASDLVIQTADGDPYLFTGADLKPTTVLDLSRSDARDWAEGKMQAAIAAGFDGWMADYGEWLPPDAVLAGADPIRDHNAYPSWWQGTNADALADTDGVFFSRSGWIGTPTVSPVTWGGDQRTDFQPDDGFPTVVPLGLGAGIAGVPMWGSDIGGYQSFGNDPSTKELWFRWCALGAFSPVMRTHHGAYLADDWQVDSDADTLAHFARYARVHTSLFPYLRGLAEKARTSGSPLLLAPFLVFPSEAWSRTDAWMLGPSLFVAPVMTEGATSRDVALPTGTTWYDWWTGAVAQSGSFDAPIDSIPVFAPAGAIVPTFTTVPDTLVDGPLDGLVTLSDADGERTIRVFAGAAGEFTEADGTRYSTDGVASGSGTDEQRITTGTLSAGGLALKVEGTIERDYRLEVVAP